MVRTPCCNKSGLKKGTWTTDEDSKLIAHVTLHGHKNWRQLPKLAGLARCGKSCRLRWMNYLRPGIKRGNYTPEEEEIIINLHARLGNRWSMIASHLPGRSDNEIKNHWHSCLKKRVQLQHSNSVKNQNTEPSQSNHHIRSQVDESTQEKNSVPSQNTCVPTYNSSPSSHDTSSLSGFFCTAPASRNGSMVIDHDNIANFLDACSWNELYHISYFSAEFLAKSFCPVYDVWGLSE